MYRKTARAAAAIAIMAACLGGTQAAQAATVSVPCSATALAVAMTSAGSGDTLGLAAGFVYRQAVLPAVTVNLTVDGNGATLRDGSGLSVTVGTLTVDHLDFRRARIVVTDFGNLTVTGGTFAGNTVSIDSGGAIDVYTAIPFSGVLSVTGATFTGNTAAGGGAISDFSNETGGITDSVFTGNAATGTLGFGGAIVASALGGVQMSGDVIRGSSAAYGGAIFAATGVAIDSSRITGNHASVRGGGLYAELPGPPGQPAAVVTSTVIRGNTATEGAGIFNDEGSAQVTGSVITRNFAAGSGGAIYNRDGQVTASDTVISRNTAGTGGGGLYPAGQFATVTLTTSPMTRNRPDNCEPANTVTGCIG